MAARESGSGLAGRISVSLGRASYAPGELLSGSVALSAPKLIRTREPLAVVIQGKESVAWDEGGDNPVGNSKEETFLTHKIVLAPDRTLYEAGDSVYPFSFRLPDELAPSFALTDVYSGAVERLRVHVKYDVSVWLTADSDSVAYLSAAQTFTMHSSLVLTPPAQSLEISASESVRWLYCINRGSLQVEVETPQDVLVAGDSVPITCRLNNANGKAPVLSFSVKLVEELVLQTPGPRPEIVITRVLSRQENMGPSAGQTLEQTVLVKLVDGEKQCCVTPTAATQLFRCSHRVVVCCKPLLAQSIECDLPIRTLHHETPLGAPSTRLEMKTAPQHAFPLAVPI